MDKNIQKLLETNKVKYKLVEHRKVYTAWNGAETQHADPRSVVKTVLAKFSNFKLYLDEGNSVASLDFAMVAVPAGKRVDFRKLAKFANDQQAKLYKKLAKENPKTKKPANVTAKMASEKDIVKHLKTKVGLLSAFSRVYGLPLLLDKKLLKPKKLLVPAGSYTESVEIAPKDLIKLSYGAQGNFNE